MCNLKKKVIQLYLKRNTGLQKETVEPSCNFLYKELRRRNSLWAEIYHFHLQSPVPAALSPQMWRSCLTCIARCRSGSFNRFLLFSPALFLISKTLIKSLSNFYICRLKIISHYFSVFLIQTLIFFSPH